MGIDENIKAEGGSSAGDDKTIQLTVKSQTGEITKFKVKTTTKFGKIFTNYAKSKGVIETALRFFIDQDRLAADDTPAKYDMQDGDEISVMIQQLGGGGC